MLIRERQVVDTVQADATPRATLMRGADGMQEGLLTLAKLDDFVPAEHPLRAIRVLVVFLCPPKSRAINGDAIAVGGRTPRAIHYSAL